MLSFSDQDMAAIREAVRAGERRTRGEIVPMVVPTSARYRETSHLAGLLSALLVLTVLLMGDYGWTRADWTGRHPGWTVLAVGIAYLLGSLLGSQPGIIRLLTSHERMATKVRLRAERAYYEHGLHKTREGTGILILLSMLERRVHILADRAINERVPPGTWDRLVKHVVQGIHDGRAAPALCEAIERCGRLLAEVFPAREGDNPNELRDEVIREP